MRRIFYTLVSVLLTAGAAFAGTGSAAPQKASSSRIIARSEAALKSARPAVKKTATFGRTALPGSLHNAPARASQMLPEIYGTVIFANGWGQSTAGVGVYAMPRTEGQYSTLQYKVDGMQGGIVVNDVYYTSLLYEVVGCPYAKAFGYDIYTGAKVFERDIDPMEVSASLTTDPTTGTIYAINYDSKALIHRLVKMHLGNGQWNSEEICTLSGSWNSVSCDANGQLWGVRRIATANSDGSMNVTGSVLCKMNKENGTFVEVGPLGVTTTYQSDADFDPISGVLYTTVSTPDSGFLATIDTATGAATKVFTYAAGEEYIGIYFATPGRPNGITDLKADISNATLSGVISFVAPRTDNLGASEGELTYKISDNGAPLASGTCAYGDTVKVNVTVTEGKHVFGARVGNAKGMSNESYVTREVVFTPDVVISLPYSNDLEGANALNGWGYIDANGDNVTWAPYNDWATENHSLRIGSSSGANLDDWAVMPAMKLEPGKVYTFKCQAWSHKNNFVEKIEGFWGAAPTVEGLNKPLFALTEVKQLAGNEQELTGEIIVEKAGYYYIGLHACSTSDKSFFLYLDNFTITAGANTKIPSPVTGFTVIPDGSSKLQATLKGTLPATDVAGNALGSIDALEIYRDDDQLVETLTEGLVPGQQFSYLDDAVLGGQHTYSVFVRNAYGRSAAATAQAFVGYPLPAAVTGAVMTEPSDRQLTVSWDEVTSDVFGLPLPSRAIRYNVYAIHGGNYEVVGRNLRDPQYTFTAPIAEGKQEYIKVEVKAETSAGEGVGSVSNMIPVGTPMAGYRESFAGRTISTPVMEEIIQGRTGTWGVYGDDTGIYAQDGDNGFIAMTAEGAKESTALITGKISLEGIENPAFAFYTYSIVAEGGNDPDTNTVEVWAREYGTEDWTVVFDNSKTVYEICGNRHETWGRVLADLSAFAGKTVQVAIVPTTVMYASVPVDNIYVTSIKDYDLQMISIKAPRKAITGNKFNVEVKVLNNGSKASGNYTVDLYADGVKMASKKVNDLAPGAYGTEIIQVEMPVLAETPVAYHAVIVHNGDQTPDNNLSNTVSVEPKHMPHPTVTDLAATVDAETNTVTLNWNEPVIETGFAETVTEGFEQADALAKEVEDWTFVDIDNAVIGGVRGYDWPGLKAGVDKAAFFVLDTEHAQGQAAADLVPRSGNKMLCAIYRQDDKTVNDWAISPILSGNAQTVTMYLRSFSSRYLETVELCYSTGSLAPTAFTVVKTVKPVPYGAWTKVELPLPEGARYFAIHNCGTNNFMLMVDDITFERGNYNDLLEIRGYNVWHNGKRANTAITADRTFVDRTAKNGDEYQVTVVYEDYGQSRGSNKVVVNSLGVDNISNAAVITAAHGRIDVRNAGASAVSVCDLQGREQFAGRGDASIAVAPGVYIVKVADRTAKVIVK